ncbi:indolepyruvate oxidoreductase subunit beta [Desulfovibrio psychrotolerans]|uniref:Indolepyruvate ferredoxin oxidoreductase subunit beta n=1 Tax=Desulfovibrio psychrotolerans TaxID=415242 RepID=A0A7J0BPU9_9BACT|nr:indolepyruvate oxidoreductase subunit beta [Desulfovibrio psychrotolerans]GFM35648.1 indolepyruvate ferredoxin oxidoreductase subunit beta [Desulfovibrio psychrotolerans]
MDRIRIFMTGVGGQGTLTATTLFARAALEQGLDVVSGEIHGMAQRGGVVESTVLLGGWKSPKISHGEADIVLGFEPLETLRALPYLAKGGSVISNTEPLPPVGVSCGRESYPSMEHISERVKGCSAKCWFLPCRTLGVQAGSVQAGNIVLLGALCASGLSPFGPQALETAIRKYLKPSLVDMNLKAVELGVQALAG